MRIYLDCCCLQRPFDDQTQPRIRVEAEAVLAILTAVEAGDVSMVGSDALVYEVNRMSDLTRRSETLALLMLASEQVEVDAAAAKLAESLATIGIKPMDAIHLALASTASVDFFGTCDDGLLNKGRVVANLRCKVVSALDLLWEVTR